MAELQLINNDRPVRRFTLSQGGISIGRAPDNQIQLDSPAVDPRHARIFTVGRSSVLQDLASQSGTYINDKEIARQTLRHDDVVQIGSFQLRFLADDVAAEKVNAREETALETEATVAQTWLSDKASVPTEATAPAPARSEVETAPKAVDTEETESAGIGETSDDQHADSAGEADTVTTISVEPESEEPGQQPRHGDRANTELKSKAVEHALDDFEDTLASEIDLELIVDSQTLLETTEELLTEEIAVPNSYAPGDPADERKPIDDFGDPTDEMAAVLTDDVQHDAETSTLKPSADSVRSDNTRETPSAAPRSDSAVAVHPAEPRAVTPSYVPPDTDVRDAAPREEKDDPVAAAIRARIEAKVKANAHLLNEIESAGETKPIEIKEVRAEALSTAEHAAMEERFTHETEAEEEIDQSAATLEDENDADDTDDDDTTILEFLPEPRHLTAAEQKIAAAKAPPPEPVGKTPSAQPLRREAAVELPAPPAWSVEGDDTAPTEVLTVQGNAGQRTKYGALDILHGPNAGLRVWLGKPRTILGNNQDRAVIIERHPSGFKVAGMPRGSTVTVNGTLLLSTPENLQNGDMIEFANMGLKFVLTDVRPTHPAELTPDKDADERVEYEAAAPATPSDETTA